MNAIDKYIAYSLHDIKTIGLFGKYTALEAKQYMEKHCIENIMYKIGMFDTPKNREKAECIKEFLLKKMYEYRLLSNN